MNASFGVDHPLLATHDIDALRNKLVTLGFTMTDVGKHPWGTSTSLAMFNGCLLEIMGVYDDSLIDTLPAGEFRFGRHVYEHLKVREGVALTALHSTNSIVDAQTATDAGFNVAGHLEFGRDVTLPDGTKDRTKTTLALMPNKTFPRLSFFLCQQHRPELIYVPQWLAHPNKVNGIRGICIVAQDAHHKTLKQQFSSLYKEGVEMIPGGMQFVTANGTIRILNTDAFQNGVGPLSDAVLDEQTPCIASIEFNTPEPDVMLKFVTQSGLSYHSIANGIALASDFSANTTLCFCTD